MTTQRLARSQPRGRTSLAEHAYEALRSLIREGAFGAGEHIREADVAERLGISRTPVREAFHRLVSEGLLVPGPWNGMTVARFDRQQIVELYAVREALEGTAARLAAQHANEAEIGDIEEMVERESSETDVAALTRLNAEFHAAIHAAARNRYLLRSLSSIADALGLLRHSNFLLPGSAATAHTGHAEIIARIRARDPEKAEDAARRHIRDALAWRLRLMSASLDGPGTMPDGQ